MKKILILVWCVIGALAFAKCDKCGGKGLFEMEIQCPLCLGYGNVSPAWFNLSVGNTRWTETTYWTGLQTKSDVHNKLFSFKTCPFCAKSKRPGSIIWTHICACPLGESRNVKAICSSARAKVKSKCKQFGLDTKEGLDGGNDEFALNMNRWMMKWQLPPKLYKKLLYEVLNTKFDTEGAHYKRSESKYTEKKFNDSDDKEIPTYARIYSDKSNENDEKLDEAKNDLDSEKSETSLDGIKMNPTLFKASMSSIRLKPYTFENCSCRLDDYYNYEYRGMEKYYWCVDITIRWGNSGFETFYGYIKKDSREGKKMFSIISDGDEHENLTLTLMYSKKASNNKHVGITSVEE